MFKLKKVQKPLFVLALTLLSSNLFSAVANNSHAYCEIKSAAEFKRRVNGKKPLIIKYSAEWCGACKQMIPVFDNIAKKYRNRADFCTIDLDNKNTKSIVKDNDIQAVPTTVFYKNGKEVSKERGSMSHDDLNQTVASFLGIKQPQQGQTSKNQQRVPRKQQGPRTKNL